MSHSVLEKSATDALTALLNIKELNGTFFFMEIKTVKTIPAVFIDLQNKANIHLLQKVGDSSAGHKH